MSECLSPDKNCNLCERLHDFIKNNRNIYPNFYNAPVPSFGNINAQLLVVGLAPGLKGANQSGRPFTGDFAGTLLYGNLIKFGFATGVYKARIDDGVELINARITNAVRCVPPLNKPTTKEMNTCLHFLQDEIKHMPNLKVILSLGSISHESVLKALDQKHRNDYKFEHNKVHNLSFNNKIIHLIDSYHTSRLNVNTGRLTEQMFEEIFLNIKEILK
ncbi:MAG: uracil-DNA glycosylase [Alphaproteobacteria bacterium]|nr:uracil-DNA glycosylase [Alphaproteobacteria bacterium]